MAKKNVPLTRRVPNWKYLSLNEKSILISLVSLSTDSVTTATIKQIGELNGFDQLETYGSLSALNNFGLAMATSKGKGNSRSYELPYADDSDKYETVQKLIEADLWKALSASERVILFSILDTFQGSITEEEFQKLREISGVFQKAEFESALTGLASLGLLRLTDEAYTINRSTELDHPGFGERLDALEDEEGDGPVRAGMFEVVLPIQVTDSSRNVLKAGDCIYYDRSRFVAMKSQATVPTPKVIHRLLGVKQHELSQFADKLSVRLVTAPMHPETEEEYPKINSLLDVEINRPIWFSGLYRIECPACPNLEKCRQSGEPKLDLYE